MNTNTIFLLNSRDTVKTAVNKDRAYAFNVNIISLRLGTLL